jgi:hypothetical protein
LAPKVSDKQIKPQDCSTVLAQEVDRREKKTKGDGKSIFLMSNEQSEKEADKEKLRLKSCPFGFAVVAFEVSFAPSLSYRSPHIFLQFLLSANRQERSARKT